MGFLESQKHTLEKFTLEIYPFITLPENIFDKGSAIQYGADFCVKYNDSSSRSKNIGLLQFVRGQNNVGTHKKDELCLDKFGTPNTFTNCLFGDPNKKIGHESSKFYQKPTCVRSTTFCESYDIPREISGAYDRKTGEFTGLAKIEFWHFVAEFDGDRGTIFKNGFAWVCEFKQSPTNINKFTFEAVELKPVQCNNTFTKILDVFCKEQYTVR